MTKTNDNQATQFIIYGISGNLSRKKILPGLYGLEERGLLPNHFKIIGTSRSKLTRATLKKIISDNLDSVDHITLNNLCDRITAVELDITEGSFKKLKHKLEHLHENFNGQLERVHYFALPPNLFETVISQIGRKKLGTFAAKKYIEKILIEKPFGENLKSAKKIQSSLHRYFEEEDIYLVDHYLAKEPVENILYFIRNNPIFADVWNCKYIRRIEIMAAEKDGIEARGEFYDKVGALRDMFQSHILEVLALITLKQPMELNDQQIKKARLDLLQSIEVFSSESSLRGQYKGYKEDVSNAHSTTETFATVVTKLNMPEWETTNIVLTSGKKMSQKRTVATLYFASDFSKVPTPNTLTFEFYPDHCVRLGVNLKTPGSHDTQSKELSYAFPLTKKDITPYQAIVLAALKGDRSVFTSTEESLVNWQTIQPLLDAWSKNGDDLIEYDSSDSLTEA